MHQFRSANRWLLAALLLGTSIAHGQGGRVVPFYGYPDCIQLENSVCRVVLCPAAGGRVLSFSTATKNVLYLPPGAEGWTWDGSSQRGKMHAGRFDIGPEQTVPRRTALWQGEWKGEITGKLSASMTSPVDEGPGVYLIRSFRLAESAARLECSQTIVNASDAPVEYCHWSRTFAVGKGICVVPISSPSRFPNAFVRYDPPGKMLNMSPDDDHVSRQGDYFVISDRPQNPKLGFDSMVGWLAYLSPQDLLFVKTFPTFPDRVYNEVAGLTISIWYPDGDMVELEPIGPRERLEKRGDRATFTETWHLLEHPYPAGAVDPDEIATIVADLVAE